MATRSALKRGSYQDDDLARNIDEMLPTIGSMCSRKHNADVEVIEARGRLRIAIEDANNVNREIIHQLVDMGHFDLLSVDWTKMRREASDENMTDDERAAHEADRIRLQIARLSNRLEMVEQHYQGWNK